MEKNPAGDSTDGRALQQHLAQLIYTNEGNDYLVNAEELKRSTQEKKYLPATRKLHGCS